MAGVPAPELNLELFRVDSKPLIRYQPYIMIVSLILRYKPKSDPLPS